MKCEKDHLNEELKLIYQIETLLDHLLTLTMEDNPLGKGCGSYYPENCLKTIKTMKTICLMELKKELRK